MSMFYGIISLLILGIWFIFSEEKNYKFIIFGFSWFLIFIFLTLIKPLGTVPEFSENRIYIPMFGFIFVILGLGMIRLPFFIKDKINYKNNFKKLILFISLLIIFIFSCVTIYRNKYYENKLNFWKNATSTSPSFAFNHNNLGAMKYLDGDMDSAEREYKIALDLNPNEPMAHGNLGLIYFKEDKFDDSLSEYKKEISINPNYDNVYFNLGLLYYKLERYSDAIDNWKKTLVINPNHIDALRTLTSYYYNNKNYEEALTYGGLLYRMGFELPPDLLRMIKLGGIN
jgi:tetratricopeptide (TPR) repeat protein